MSNFYENVQQWAHERNITKGAKAKRQRTKTWEELGELSEGMSKSKLELVKDAIGDCAVTTANVINCMGLDSVRIGQHATEIVAARQDLFKQMDADDLLNAFIAHQAIVKTGHDDNSHLFLPFVVQYDEQLAISLACLEVLASRLDLTFTECQDFAWNEIKDRKGMMINGTFIKEADVEASLQSIVNKVTDSALSAYGDNFVNDTAGALNDCWNAIRGYVARCIGDTFDLSKSSMGINDDTVTVHIVVNAYKTFDISTTRTVEIPGVKE